MPHTIAQEIRLPQSSRQTARPQSQQTETRAVEHCTEGGRLNQRRFRGHSELDAAYMPSPFDVSTNEARRVGSRRGLYTHVSSHVIPQ